MILPRDGIALMGGAPVRETARMRSESVVANVAVWATSKRTEAKAKVRGNQSVDPADRRHVSSPKLSAANVAYPSTWDGALPSRPSDAATGKREKPLSEISEISEIQTATPAGVSPVSETTHGRSAPTATWLAQIAEIAEISKASIKCASKPRRDVSREIAEIAEIPLCSRQRAEAGRNAAQLHSG